MMGVDMLMMMNIGLRSVSSIFLLNSSPVSVRSFMAASTLGRQVSERVPGLLEEHVVEGGLGQLDRLELDSALVQQPHQLRESVREILHAEPQTLVDLADLQHEVAAAERVGEHRH